MTTFQWNRRLAMPLFSAMIALAQAPPSNGTVEIASVTVSKIPFDGRVEPGCAWVAVRVVVQKGGIRDDPTLFISFAKYRSDPADSRGDITPPWIAATLTGSAVFGVNVCSVTKIPAKFTIEAAILGVAPEDKFSILAPDPPSKAQAEITFPGRR